MANEQNLIPAVPGQVLNPNGRPKGSVNRKTILNWLLFECDLDEMGVIKTKPSWYDNVKPKTLYEMMTVSMAIKAMGGDAAAFNALNNALGLDINAGGQVDVVHIFKPEKLAAEDFNKAGAELREHTKLVVEGEIVDDQVASPSRPPDISPASP